MSANTILYYRRKALGVCVRCEAPTKFPSVLCQVHLEIARSVRKQKVPDDSPGALPCAYEPPRAPYQSDYRPVMPPRPDKCPRCSGFLYTAQLEWGEPVETKCVMCGWRLNPVMHEVRA